MQYDFDPAKSVRNMRERGFDFDFSSLVFDGDPLKFRDTRRDYGEVRMIAIGAIESRIFKVVFKDRSEVRRIISAHRASRQKKRIWRMK